MKRSDTAYIYEKILLNTCFNRLKAIRNSWVKDNDEKLGIDSIIDFGGDDFRTYNYIMENSESIILEMIPNLVNELMKVYRIEAQWYPIHQNEAKIFSIKKDENWPDYVERSNQRKVFAFSCKINKNQTALFIFKEFGITNQLPESLISTIMKQHELDVYFYISLVEDDAYKEIINHSANIKDPTRGTRRLSLRQFFDLFFDSTEYEIFKKYAKDLTMKIKDYFGFEIVRTLTPNSLHNYKKKIRNNLLKFDIRQNGENFNFSDEQKDILDSNFFGEKNYELLMGSSDFAQSFMTSEWLYSSLKDAGNIDLTSIAMGYFKSIEQFLFSYIKLHTLERDGKNRKIYAGHKPLDDLTESLILDKKKINNINLGSLVSFFGDYDKNENLHSRNKDLLVSGLTDETYDFIVKQLSSIPELRNGYFHKHNLIDWRVVEDARNTSILIFYLFLGGYHLSRVNKKELGWIETVRHDDYYKLCEYINSKALEEKFLDNSIVYLNGTTELYDFWFIKSDHNIEFDNYGEAVYSGIYLHRVGENKKYLQINNEKNIPNEIWEGTLQLSKNLPLEIKPSGPQKKIFSKGKFIE